MLSDSDNLPENEHPIEQSQPENQETHPGSLTTPISEIEQVKEFAVKRPNVFFVCMHKAASTFIADVLFQDIAARTRLYEPYLVGSFLIEFINAKKKDGLIPARNPQERMEQLVMLFQHRNIPASNGLIGRLYPAHLPPMIDQLESPFPGDKNRVCVMVRDPRDALVSLYYSMTFSHSVKSVEGDNSRFVANREELQRNGSVTEGLKMILTKRGVDSTIPEFIRSTNFILDNNNVLSLSYELLVTDPHLWLAKFAEHAGIEELLSESWMDNLAENFNPPAEEDPMSHKRRIKPGNWADVFDQELEAIYKQRCGSRLEQFGYSW
ncbi:MAG TPA: sulfotransferase domain-containing protein [Pirellulaceae bacterium]|nr:sulfotransferase domain-containing protein [Pirellulaceae bacterium]HMO91611.1 sulfotransferase domain-containing protein [Pirellulaceae bacterium]HMP68308.1 sulfotransferase domain-containing protein [Pirellulaceae bacterium]